MSFELITRFCEDMRSRADHVFLEFCEDVPSRVAYVSPDFCEDMSSRADHGSPEFCKDVTYMILGIDAILLKLTDYDLGYA
ncbi:hypothetical protein L3X38_042938 [Prunus dulcis]|uniref:Uncharacterized protein n=1 Tax=Prunus dulcis TaxID=3755 RepID=A0AAD4YKT0_PRUDU|nr:hypothetical protein L3X38_042938 [Prunus dulcis]